MLVLGIESSCDETGAAVVADGRWIRSSVVASQADLHAHYGGVVPEVASRQQVAAIVPVIETALAEAHATWDDLHAVAATYGPGLAGSLLVGLTAAKTIAWARGLPFLGVNHLEAHIYANWLRPAATPDSPLPAQSDSEPSSASSPLPGAGRGAGGERSAITDTLPGDPLFPLLALVVSGAHTELVHIPRHGRYELLGQTRDDAAGEAFDKVARILGLSYPGGPSIQRAAAASTGHAATPPHLPRAWLRGTHDFSFSGLKTAALQQVRATWPDRTPGGDAEDAPRVAALAAAFQEAVVDVLSTKTSRAAQALGVRQVVLAGGVAANLALRYPPVIYCTDNAAMIAGAAAFHLSLGERHDLSLDVLPGLQLPFASA